MEPGLASAEWKELYNENGAITDQLGTHPKYRARVVVKVKAFIIARDAQIAAQGYTSSSKEDKKATAETMKEMEARMQQGFNMEMSTHLSRGEQARAMVMAKNAAASASDNAFGEEAFSEAGRAAMHIPNVKELLPPKRTTTRRRGTLRQREQARHLSLQPRVNSPRSRKKSGLIAMLQWQLLRSPIGTGSPINTRAFPKRAKIWRFAWNQCLLMSNSRSRLKRKVCRPGSMLSSSS
jgi:hypothetical protein